MRILQSATFAKVVKKLHPNQKADLDNAVHTIISNPTIGELKTGDLTDIRVYKFRMVSQLTLFAYIYNEQFHSITLLALGSHENFYRNLKRIK